MLLDTDNHSKNYMLMKKRMRENRIDYILKKNIETSMYIIIINNPDKTDEIK